MRLLLRRLTGYVLLIAGVVVAFVGLIALRSRGEASGDLPWGWPEAIVLLIAVPLVVGGLWVLSTRRFDRDA
jgi:hypothetical protein